MIRDWKAYSDQVRAGVKELGTSVPDTVKAYAEFHHATSKFTHLDAKTRELIALGVAISLRCDGCIDAHTQAAIKAGATKEEISEALGTAIMVNAGAAMVYSTHVLDAYNTFTSPVT
jgi:AhpD family alkylhydroperoxidase